MKWLGSKWRTKHALPGKSKSGFLLLFSLRVTGLHEGATGRKIVVYSPDTSLEQRLREAERAESELARLKPLAEAAPQLREAKAKAEVAAERSRRRNASLEEARKAASAATEKQKQVPEILDTASRAVKDLYTALKEIDRYRQAASQSLALVDRIDYDIELEEGEARELSMDRDPRGLAYVLAARHGENKVAQLLEELDPGFDHLRDCHLDEPIRRDLAKFVLSHAVHLPAPTPKPAPAVQPQAEQAKPPEPAPPAEPSPATASAPKSAPTPPEDPRGPLTDPRRLASPMSPPPDPRRL